MLGSGRIWRTLTLRILQFEQPFLDFLCARRSLVACPVAASPPSFVGEALLAGTEAAALLPLRRKRLCSIAVAGCRRT